MSKANGHRYLGYSSYGQEQGYQVQRVDPNAYQEFRRHQEAGHVVQTAQPVDLNAYQESQRQHEAGNYGHDQSGKSEAKSHKIKWGISGMKAKAASWGNRKVEQSKVSSIDSDSREDPQDDPNLPIAKSMEQQSHASKYSAAPSPPFDDQGNYRGSSYSYDPASRALKKNDRRIEYQDNSFDSNVAEVNNSFLIDVDENPTPLSPSLSRRPVNANANPSLDLAGPKQKADSKDAQVELQRIHLDVLTAMMDKHPELKGPGPGHGYDSTESAVMAILDKYGELSARVRNPNAQLENTSKMRLENVKYQDELRAANTKLQERLDAKDEEMQELQARTDRDSESLNKHIASLQFQLDQSRSEHGAVLRKQKRATETEIDKLKSSYENVIREKRNEIDLEKRETYRRHDHLKKTIDDLNTQLQKDSSLYHQSNQKFQGIIADLEHRLRNVKKDEQDRIDELEDEWDEKLSIQAQKYEDSMKKLRVEMVQLEKDLDKERSHKAQALQTQRDELMEQYEDQLNRQRTVIEDFKLSSSRREHFKGLTDSEVAALYKRLANNIEDFSRLDWDFQKELDWPFTETRLRQLHPKNTRKLKQQIIQNTLWVLLWEFVFRSPFRVFGIDGREYDLPWTEIYSKGTSSFDWPEVSNETERNRFESAKAFMDTVEQPSNHSSLKESFEESLSAAISAISRAFSKVASMQAKDRKVLESIVRLAAKVWLESCSQRYRLMVITSGSSGDILSNGVDSGSLKLIVRPDLLRYGDSQGKDLMRGEPLAGWKGQAETYAIPSDW